MCAVGASGHVGPSIGEPLTRTNGGRRVRTISLSRYSLISWDFGLSPCHITFCFRRMEGHLDIP